MAKIKVLNQVIPDSVHRIDEDYTEEYKKLVEEANKKIEAGKRRELKAWKDAKNFIAMNAFMEKLENGTLTREIEPTISEEFIPTDEIIISQLDSYTKLLKSGIIEKATLEEKGPKLMKIR